MRNSQGSSRWPSLPNELRNSFEKPRTSVTFEIEGTPEHLLYRYQLFRAKADEYRLFYYVNFALLIIGACIGTVFAVRMVHFSNRGQLNQSFCDQVQIISLLRYLSGLCNQENRESSNILTVMGFLVFILLISMTYGYALGVKAYTQRDSKLCWYLTIGHLIILGVAVITMDILFLVIEGYLSFVGWRLSALFHTIQDMKLKLMRMGTVVD